MHVHYTSLSRFNLFRFDDWLLTLFKLMTQGSLHNFGLKNKIDFVLYATMNFTLCLYP